MAVVSGTGAGGTSCVPLSGGARLGPDGARRLADMLRAAAAPLLASLDLRCRGDARRRMHARTRARARTHTHTHTQA